MKTETKRPTDVNQFAKFLVDIVTGEVNEDVLKDDIFKPIDGKNPVAVALGRLGGLKGGKARAESLSPEKRSEIAKLAAEKRWGGKAKKE